MNDSDALEELLLAMSYEEGSRLGMVAIERSGDQVVFRPVWEIEDPSDTEKVSLGVSGVEVFSVERPVVYSSVDDFSGGAVEVLEKFFPRVVEDVERFSRENTEIGEIARNPLLRTSKKTSPTPCPEKLHHTIRTHAQKLIPDIITEIQNIPPSTDIPCDTCNSTGTLMQSCICIYIKRTHDDINLEESFGQNTYPPHEDCEECLGTGETPAPCTRCAGIGTKPRGIPTFIHTQGKEIFIPGDIHHAHLKDILTVTTQKTARSITVTWEADTENLIPDLDNHDIWGQIFLPIPRLPKTQCIIDIPMEKVTSMDTMSDTEIKEELRIIFSPVKIARTLTQSYLDCSRDEFTFIHGENRKKIAELFGYSLDGIGMIRFRTLLLEKKVPLRQSLMKLVEQSSEKGLIPALTTGFIATGESGPQVVFLDESYDVVDSSSAMYTVEWAVMSALNN